jgi:enoyl-CoA hydratase/carnithine racemase
MTGAAPVTQPVLDLRSEDGVAFLTLRRPARHNALNPQLMRSLSGAWQEIAMRRDLRVAVLAGEGPSFCSGMDIGQTHPGFGYLAHARDAQDEQELAAADALEALSGERRKLHYTPPPGLGKPVIAALHGRVSGGGLELALGCDIRIAADDTVFALPEVTRGIVPGSGGMYWLPRVVGLGRALEMILTGEPIDAQEALRIGLVNRVVGRDELNACASAMATRIAANAPLAVQAARDAVMRSLGTGPGEGLEISENLGRVLRTTSDYEEGFRAFAQKRPPQFTGR